LPESTTRRIPKICTIAVDTAFGMVLNLIHGTLDRDHAGGNNGMKRLLKDVKVYGGVKDKVEGCTHTVQHHDEFPISCSIRVKALEMSWYVSFFSWTPHNGCPFTVGLFVVYSFSGLTCFLTVWCACMQSY
jgi:hypothetical protein